MRLLGSGILAIVAILIAGYSPAATQKVRIDTGLVQGVIDGNIAVYKGIPFASPPVGNLRWKAPQRAKVWKTALKADKFPSQCSQVGPPLPTMPEEPTSEDCLYLNIWAPLDNGSAAKRPVMVFLYGGGFRQGSGSTPLYSSGGLPKSTGVILVTLNYRVGPLGFLAHPELTAESPRHVSGNYALLDAIAGLQWVKRNIAAFDGDPNKVTIFGQSAGSQLVSLLMISPPARGLFHAAIAESNANMGPGMAVLADAEKSGVAFAASLGAYSIAELRKVSAEKISGATFEIPAGTRETNQAWPIVDGYLIPGETYTLFAEGRQANVPLLLGYNEDEGQYFQTPQTVAAFVAAVRKEYGTFADQFLVHFPATNDEEASRSNSKLWAESAFGWQMWCWARINAQTSRSKTYFYYFSSKYGNAHGAELPYVFQYPFGEPWNNDQREIGRKVAAYWTNFASNGNPNGSGLPDWPEFNVRTNPVMHIGQTFQSGAMPEQSAHFLMDTFMNAKRAHTIN
jgi:para-nitrobenzyl esterase